MITLPHAVYLLDSSGSAIKADQFQRLMVRSDNDVDTFGAEVAHTRISQLSSDFSQPIANNDVTSSTTNGGVVTTVSSSAILSSSTDANGTAKLYTNTVLSYSPGREAYVVFTAAFTTPTSVNSNQRIGVYNSSDGFYIGYEGTTFGVSHRRAGINTFTSKASFSDDLLVGSIDSMFTRKSTPEAIDVTKKNVYRIRFGWLGAAPIKFEVLSPDGVWILFHTIRYPNTQVAPSLLNVALPVTAEVNKTGADATDILINTTCWDAGVVEGENSDLSYSGIIASNGAVFTSNTKGGGSITYNITGSFTGSMVIEGHNGDNRWQSITGYTPLGISYTTITGSTFFSVNCAAYAQVRLRSTAWTSGTASLQSSAASEIGQIFITNLPFPTAKGTQASLATPVQDIKDTGRTYITYYAVAASASATTVEAMISLTRSVNTVGSGPTSTSGSSFTITAGKTFRIQNITIATRGHATATAQATTFTLRSQEGTVTTGSNRVLSSRCATPATALAWDRAMFIIPDGFEIAGSLGGTTQIGISANSVYVTNSPTWDVTIIGYEY
jgi:hypothetical protein